MANHTTGVGDRIGVAPDTLPTMRYLLLFLGFAACSGGSDDPSGDPVDSGTTAAVGDDDDDTVVADDDPCVPPGEPTLEIGIGLAGYESIEPGGRFPLIHGPQGGYHLELGLRATNLVGESGELLRGEIIGRVDGMDADAEAFPYLDLRCVRDYRESYGTLLVFPDPETVTPEFLDGKEVEIEVHVTDADGNVVSTSATYVIEDTE